MNVQPLPVPLASVLNRYRGSQESEPPSRGRGRPLKRNAEYLRQLIEAHRAVEAWFLEARGCRPSSDCQLYTAYFAERFKAGGERAGKAAAPDFQRSLKTLRNELAEARRLERMNPGN